MKKRIIYIGLSLFFLFLCVLIVIMFSSNHFIRGFLGDAVIVMFLYCLAKSIWDFNSRSLCIGVIAFAYLIEFSQYLKIVPLLGFKENYFTRLIFGSVFDPLDLLAYTLGGVFVYFLDEYIVLNYLKSRSRESTS